MDQIIQDILCNVKEYLKGLTGNDRFFADKVHQHRMNDITDYDCHHGDECHTKEYAAKNYVDNQDSDLQTNIDAKSKVTFSRTLNPDGNKTKEIGKITITTNNNTTTTSIYCDKNTDTVYTHPSTHPATIITDSNAHSNIGSAANATQSTINTKIDTKLSEKSPIVTFTPTLTSGTNTKEIGKIKIGSVETKLYCDKNTDTVYTHPSTHPASMITDSNKHFNIGSNPGEDQGDINTLIDTALSTKENKVPGKGLSTNDLTDGMAYKLDTVYEGARARKRPLGYLIESSTDTSNQPLIEIQKGTKLKVRLYESENGNIITSKQNISYPDNLGITYIIFRDDFATFNGNHLIKTVPDGAEIAINLNPGHYMMTFSFVGTDNFYPVYRTIILKVV